MYSSDLTKLVIKNVALLEEAPKVVAEIEKNLYEAINQRFKNFLEQHEEWKGSHGHGEKGDETTVAPKSWPEDEAGSYWAWYTFTSIEDCEYNYDLTALLGETPNARFALAFGVYNEGLCGMNRRSWKDFLLKKYLARPELKLNGVQLQGEVLLIPIRLDAAAVEAEYPDDLDECLKPVDEALCIMMKVHPQIHEIVDEAVKLRPAPTLEASAT